jgi:hypothetical protein
MKKWIFFLFLLLIPFSQTTAYNPWAPNIFAEADRGSWEWKEISRMCDEGKAPHYSGEKIRQASLSRYELAAVVIDLSENENALTPDEKESLKKIRQSYSRELEARNWKEEKSPDQAEIHGDLRIRKTDGKPADGRARIGILYHIGQHAEAGAEEIK